MKGDQENKYLCDNTIEKIYKSGQYYNPAVSHYWEQGYLITDNTIISCDKCHRTSLDVCIGLEDFDLCLECITKISCEKRKKKEANEETNRKRQQKIVTRMMVSDFRY